VAPVAPKTVTAALRLESAKVDEVAQFTTSRFTPAGLAYDAVSKRFLFGDLTGRRLLVVGEGSSHVSDLVRAESAGFDDVTAFAIDPKRGELWVASTGANSRGGTLHHLQLISGRPLTRFVVPGQRPVQLADVAVAGDGAVFVLDSGAPRVLVLRPGAAALEELMTLSVVDPAGLAIDEAGRFAYVAHRDGISRLNVAARRATAMDSASGITLTGFQFVRFQRDVLIGGQRQPDGSPGLVRLQMNGDHVTAATLIETLPVDESLRGPATIAGNALYYLVADNSNSKSGAVNLRIRRVTLP